MTMTRRDFEAVALILRTTAQRHTEFNSALEVVDHIAENLAALYARKNPQFNTKLFFAAAFHGVFSNTSRRSAVDSQPQHGESS